MPWQAVECDDYIKSKKEFIKKWLPEMMQVAANLRTLFLALHGGTKAEQLKNLSFVHSEPLGILAISEKGVAKSSPKAFRLYIYPEYETELVHLMLIGEKQSKPSQNRDIQLCKTYVQGLIDSHQKK